MDIQLNDILEMKKLHPCGEKRWLVLRTEWTFACAVWAAAGRS